MHDAIDRTPEFDDTPEWLDSRARFMPSPAEIAAALQEIQATWTDEERFRRATGRLRPVTWRAPEVVSAVRDDD